MSQNTLMPGLIGRVVGAVATAGILVGGGLTVMNSVADKQALQASQVALSDAFTSICVEQFKADPERVAQLKVLQATAQYSRDEFVVRRGWARMPGESTHYRNVPESCANAILELNK